MAKYKKYMIYDYKGNILYKDLKKTNIKCFKLFVSVSVYAWHHDIIYSYLIGCLPYFDSGYLSIGVLICLVIKNMFSDYILLMKKYTRPAPKIKTSVKFVCRFINYARVSSFS